MANANTPTPRMLDEAGLEPGMRVLDVGCAMGLLTRDLAVRVGPGGAVVGIDCDASRLTDARGQEAAPGSAPIDYVAADLAQALPDLGTFDAIIGRRVLMYLSDPATALKRLVALLRPGGIMAWHEHAGIGCPFSAVPLPLHQQLAGWIWQTIEHEGGRRETALRLPAMLGNSGIAVASLRGEAIFIGGPLGSDAANMARMMLPRMHAAGVIDTVALDEEVFIAGLVAEAETLDAPILWDMAYLVIGRKV